MMPGILTPTIELNCARPMCIGVPEPAIAEFNFPGADFASATSSRTDATVTAGLDVAEETANLTRTTILQQAGVSVLAQANQQPSLALSLLR